MGLGASISFSSKNVRRREVSKTTSNSMRPVTDRSLWQEAVRDVRPLRERHAPPMRMPKSEPELEPAGTERSRAEPLRTPAALDRFAGIDRANAERLKRGLHNIEARLDLHGMTQAEAQRELVAFIAMSRDAGRRCVLVITGRGLGPNGPGVLKSSVPRWLEEPELRRHVLATASAQPRHGGAGATYLLLRRRR
jgi:DNA-nicking Smr family endonuclease